MKPMTVYFDDETHADIVGLARRTGVSTSELVRTATVLLLEDDLDVIALDRRLHHGDPDAFVQLNQLLERVRHSLSRHHS
jgi:hypothetical protein